MDGLLGFWLFHPPTFEGGTYRSSMATWLRNIEKILDAKGYSNAQSVRLAPLMLKGEAKLWWRGLQGRMAAWDTLSPGRAFRTLFLERYLPTPLNRGRVELLPGKARAEGKEGVTIVPNHVTWRRTIQKEEEGGLPSVQLPGRTSSLGLTTHQDRSKWKPLNASLIPKSLVRPHQEAPRYLSSG
ncbi:Retrotransposable element Tf2 [Sesbania bispinosa]|nr:Retrotransposable element Tf2 [Sesbania bispinosa]